MSIKIKENSWFAKLAAMKLRSDSVAIVFGSTIHLHNTTREQFLANEPWVCHELRHVQQYKQFGFTGFLVRYLIEWIRHGYYNNKFEVEARQSENDRELLSMFKPVK